MIKLNKNNMNRNLNDKIIIIIIIFIFIFQISYSQTPVIAQDKGNNYSSNTQGVNKTNLYSNSTSTKGNAKIYNSQYVSNTKNEQSNSQNTTTSNDFQTVKIGTQVWSKKNLDVSTFRNGDPILYVTNMEDWKNAGYYKGAKTPAWCYYQFDPSNNEKYGKLYNWYAVNDPRGLATEGWHIPSNVEWDILKNYLGSEIGKKMKNASGWDKYKTGGKGYKDCPNCKDWNSEYRRKVPCHTCQDSRVIETYTPEIYHSGNGNNSSGFSALPGGKTNDNRVIQFYGGGFMAFWWSSTGEISSFKASTRQLESIYDSYRNSLSGGDMRVHEGASVRCIKD
jgi:uncharacterized protein (TIGR02145 family)